LINGQCYLCGIKTSDIHFNGIDRYDSNKGYSLENCKTCCTSCNILKKNLSFNEFIDKYMQQYGGFRHFDIDDLNAAIKYSEENNCLNRYIKIGNTMNVMLVVQVIPTEISLIY
jgi:hypothetical protein